jgi:hypothetical protein
MFEKCATNVNRIGVGRLLNAGGEIDTITEKVIVFDQHISEVQTKAHALWALVVLPRQRQRSSDVHGTLHLVDRTRELDKHRVAHRLEKAALALGNLGIDQVAADGKPPSGAGLIGLHQARIADYISD